MHVLGVFQPWYLYYVCNIVFHLHIVLFKFCHILE